MLKKLIVGDMQTNCYVVYNSFQECIIIDPGARGQKISKFIEKNHLKVLAILITHGHFDHIGAVDYLYDKYHCSIYTHALTNELLLNPQLNLSFYDIPMKVNAPVKETSTHMKLSHYEIEWMLLEGHCQGSSMIYFPNEGYLFSGDVLFKGSIGRFDFPTSSHFQTKQSLGMIQSLSFDARVLPGHGEETTLLYEKKNNPYLKS